MNTDQNQISQTKTSYDEKYLKVRQQAHLLDTELESAEKQYQKEALQLIKKLQQKFYKTYGNKIDELEDLQDAITQYQNKGLKQLKRGLQKLYLEEVETIDADKTETALTVQMGGNNSVAISKNLQQKAKKLYDEYRSQYCPDDDYQRKRDKEASRLQKSILHNNGQNQPTLTDGKYHVMYI